MQYAECLQKYYNAVYGTFYDAINISWAYYPYRDKNSSCFDLLKIIIRETILMTPVIISTCDIFFFDLEDEMFLWTQQLETRNAQADFAIAALAADV